MNIAMWVLAGGILGWIAFQFLDWNGGRGPIVSIVIGAVGGFVGGNIIAPMFSAVASVPANFSSSALLYAAAVAAAFLFSGNLIHDRWGV